jgi:hypothetical protein
MNQFVQHGVAGTGHVARSIAILGADITKQLEQLTRSVLTGAVVIAAGHLMGNPRHKDR